MQDYLAENQWPVWVSLIISFAILFTIVCFPSTHKFAFDYMLLFGFTVFFSVCVGAITGRCVPVLLAISLLLSLYGTQKIVLSIRNFFDVCGNHCVLACLPACFVMLRVVLQGRWVL